MRYGIFRRLFDLVINQRVDEKVRALSEREQISDMYIELAFDKKMSDFFCFFRFFAPARRQFRRKEG